MTVQPSTEIYSAGVYVMGRRSSKQSHNKKTTVD